ncbi:MAG TPA: transcription antitermination factor NusB [Candidatus Saccharimonadales bacterium]|nr:transcription antitermination factor NusB [Candidatus Saccharimonadales bacterium]
MASNRHLGRIIALQTLFEQDFRRAASDAGFDLQAVLDRNIDRYKATVDDKEFIERLVHGVDAHARELDVELQPVAPEWPIDQIARMDRVVLRMGLYELKYEKDVPAKVVINEAVELAKAFGSENSSKFVNGVLGTVYRKLNGEDIPENPKKPTQQKPEGTSDARVSQEKMATQQKPPKGGKGAA